MNASLTPWFSMLQRNPSPKVKSLTDPPGQGRGQVVKTPAVVIAPRAPGPIPPVVNHMAPSGPRRTCMTVSPLSDARIGKVVIAACGGDGTKPVGVLDGDVDGVG